MHYNALESFLLVEFTRACKYGNTLTINEIFKDN